MRIWPTGQVGTTHVFVDGKEVDSFVPQEYEKRDLKKLFGDDLGGFAKVHNVRVAMDIDDASLDIFEVNLEGTANLLKEMSRPEAN